MSYLAGSIDPSAKMGMTNPLSEMKADTFNCKGIMDQHRLTKRELLVQTLLTAVRLGITKFSENKINFTGVKTN